MSTTEKPEAQTPPEQATTTGWFAKLRPVDKPDEAGESVDTRLAARPGGLGA